MIKWTDNLLKAKDFFRQAHDSINHKRKYNGLPYWTHTEEVAGIVANVLDVEDCIIAALGHDYLEDVATVSQVFTRERLQKEVSPISFRLIEELTDVFVKENYPQYNRDKRKALERIRFLETSTESHTIKLADLISNTRSIVAEDQNFARVYLKEKLALLPYLADGSSILLNEASQQVIEGFKALGMSLPSISR